MSETLILMKKILETAGTLILMKKILETQGFHNVEYTQRCIDYSEGSLTGFALYKDRRIFFKVSYTDDCKPRILHEYNILRTLNEKGIDFVPRALYCFPIENYEIQLPPISSQGDVLSHIEEGEIQILVTEYIEGKSLDDMIYGKEFIDKVCDSLEKLYRLYDEVGIVHRDWHLSNIIQSGDMIYIIDFEGGKDVRDNPRIWERELSVVVDSLGHIVPLVTSKKLRRLCKPPYSETYRESMDEVKEILRSGLASGAPGFRKNA